MCQYQWDVGVNIGVSGEHLPCTEVCVPHCCSLLPHPAARPMLTLLVMSSHRAVCWNKPGSVLKSQESPMESGTAGGMYHVKDMQMYACGSGEYMGALAATIVPWELPDWNCDLISLHLMFDFFFCSNVIKQNGGVGIFVSPNHTCHIGCHCSWHCWLAGLTNGQQQL